MCLFQGLTYTLSFLGLDIAIIDSLHFILDGFCTYSKKAQNKQKFRAASLYMKITCYTMFCRGVTDHKTVSRI